MSRETKAELIQRLEDCERKWQAELVEKIERCDKKWGALRDREHELMDQVVDQHKKTIDTLVEKLKSANAESTRLKEEKSRQEGNLKAYEGKLASIRQVVSAAFRTWYDVDLSAKITDTTEEIRLLRHVHGLAKTGKGDVDE